MKLPKSKNRRNNRLNRIIRFGGAFTSCVVVFQIGNTWFRVIAPPFFEGVKVLMIKVEISGGGEISSTCKEAHELSKRLQCGIIFDFNNVEVDVFPLSDPGVIAQSWWEAHSKIIREHRKKQK